MIIIIDKVIIKFLELSNLLIIVGQWSFLVPFYLFFLCYKWKYISENSWVPLNKTIKYSPYDRDIFLEIYCLQFHRYVNIIEFTYTILMHLLHT